MYIQATIRRSVLTVLLILLASCVNAPTAGPARPTPRSGDRSPTATLSLPSGAQPLAISGAGATLPAPLYQRWLTEYSAVDPSVKLSYQAIGSGNGIRQITARAVDFGASDAILTSDQVAAAPGLRMLPTVGGAVVIIYNVPEMAGQDSMVLTGDILAGILEGRITRWQDPAIVELNPSANLPDRDIVVVHRSDASGTTAILTAYLQAVSAEWRSQIGQGQTVPWPVGLGGKGNEGVAAQVQANLGALGYVELAYARNSGASIARLRNSAGNVVEPSVETTQSAMADFANQMPDTLACSIVNAPGSNSWPIAGYTYLLVYQDQDDCAKAQKLVAFLRWALTGGSRYARELEYVPLPDDVRRLVFARLDTITCHGAPLQ